MGKSRKYINSLISNLEFLLFKYENIKNDIIRITSQKDYDQTIEHYDLLIKKLSEESISLPIGYRYTGKLRNHTQSLWYLKSTMAQFI